MDFVEFIVVDIDDGAETVLGVLDDVRDTLVIIEQVQVIVVQAGLTIVSAVFHDPSGSVVAQLLPAAQLLDQVLVAEISVRSLGHTGIHGMAEVVVVQSEQATVAEDQGRIEGTSHLATFVKVRCAVEPVDDVEQRQVHDIARDGILMVDSLELADVLFQFVVVHLEHCVEETTDVSGQIAQHVHTQQRLTKELDVFRVHSRKVDVVLVDRDGKLVVKLDVLEMVVEYFG